MQDEPVEDDRPEYLRKLFPLPRTRNTPAAQPLNPKDATRYAKKALNSEVEELARTPDGRRNQQLNRAGFNLSQLVAGGYLSHDDTWDALVVTARSIGLTDKEIDATLHSAFRAGQQQPRAVADREEYTPPPVTVLKLADAVVDEDTDEDPLSLDKLFPPLNWDDLWADETVDEWIVQPILPARRLVALFSPPKIGKSLLMLELAVAVSRGTEVLGVVPDRPRRVLYVDFENDPRGDIRARLQAMGRGPQDLKDLVYLSFPQLAYLDTFMGGTQLMAVVDHHRVEVVVIDTISRAVEGEENDNDTWLGFYRNTGLKLKAANVACIRLDHTGKDQSKGMRGGSAKYGDVDAVWSMVKLTEDTFRLDCTANRLPIAEKVLVVERHTDPYLRHAVTTKSTGMVINAAAQRVADELDRLGLGLLGFPTAKIHLDATGFSYTEQALKDAVKLRKDNAAKAAKTTTFDPS